MLKGFFVFSMVQLRFTAQVPMEHCCWPYLEGYVKLWEQYTLKHSVIHSRILKDIVKNIKEKMKKNDNGKNIIKAKMCHGIKYHDKTSSSYIQERW